MSKKELGRVFAAGLFTLFVISYSFSNAFAITQSELIAASTEVANYMEEYRKLPADVQVGAEVLSTSQFLCLLGDAILDIHQETGNAAYTVPVVSDPSNPYPSITFNDAFYKSPLNKTTYTALISAVKTQLDSGGQAPDYFTYEGSDIRYCAAVHYAASILRFYDFFGFLPDSMDIKVISPKNLVPGAWDTPAGMEEYTSAVTYHITAADNVYYLFNVIDYETFKLAKNIIESTTLFPDLYSSLDSIYHWVVFDTWHYQGYGMTASTPFGTSGKRSAREAWTSRFSTSGNHDLKMNALYRALGIPSYWYYVYYDSESRWVNTDPHVPFDYPLFLDENGNMFPPMDDSPLPSKTEAFVNEIRSLVHYEGTLPNQHSDIRGLFINASDITTYGADSIVNAALQGGFNAIFLNVKSAYGVLYANQDVVFPAEFYDPVTVYGQEKVRIQAVDFDPLFTAAQSSGIQVHLAFNILSDYLTVINALQEQYGSVPFWSQYDGVSSYQTAMISPCVSNYKTLINSILSIYLTRYPADGIVIMDLRWLTGPNGSNGFTLGQNPLCDPYKTSSDWYEQILNNYLQDLVTTIRNINTDIYISFLSASSGKQHVDEPAGNVDEIEGRYNGQNFSNLAQHVDNFILNIGGYYWLTDNFYDANNDYGYDFEKLFYDVSTQSSTPVSIAFNLRDEWEYPAKFFKGLYNYTHDAGFNGFSVYSMASGWGEWGPAFTESQWDKIQYINLLYGEGTCADNDMDGYGSGGGCNGPDCNDNDPSVNPAVTEVPYNGKDDDCNASTLDDDLDSDGYPIASDCNDNDPSVNPAVTEVPYNGKDDDCNASTLDDDLDSDGYPIASDCNDADPAIHPSAGEGPSGSPSCSDGIDNDCDGLVDMEELTCFCTDSDGDGIFIEGGSCGLIDCNDNDPTVYPGAPRICDGKDNNCDGRLDFTTDVDNDGDGYIWCGGDCDDRPDGADGIPGNADDGANIHPGAAIDECDGINNDCTGLSPLERDWDGDGSKLCDAVPDCNDVNANMYPGNTEMCGDTLDNDCDGYRDESASEDPLGIACEVPAGCEGSDMDGDGIYDENDPDCPFADDCDDTDPAVYPGAPRICDGKDNNCDGRLDFTTDVDNDGDGFPRCNDCNDFNANIYPGPGAEGPSGDPTCSDGIDNDCDYHYDTSDADCQ